MPDLPSATIRAARDDDAEGLMALIAAVFAEYEGCVFDLGEMPELGRIASAFAEAGGRFWIAERAGRVVGSIGVAPAHDPGGVELKKLYVDASERRNGLGGRLCEIALAEARAQGARFIDLWSDTRFTTAHAFYERRGWRRDGTTRELHDLSDTVEFYFRREL